MYSPATASGQQTTSPPAGKDPASHSGASRVRRRNRVIASCLNCRQRKLKCDKNHPCSNCARFRRDCVYLAPALDSASQQKLAAIKDKMGTLEQSLERDVARRTSNNKGNLIKVESESEEDDGLEYDDEKNLQPDPFAAMDQVYEDDADDDIMDLGIQLGKMRVSERIGGYFRPRFSEELRTYPDRSDIQGLGQSGQSAQNWLLSESPAAFLGPGPDYIAPVSSFFFPSSSARTALQDYLPTKPTCDALLNNYWHAVHPIVTIVHKPTFKVVYDVFWQHVATGAEPPASTQSVVFAALFMSAVSLSNATAMELFGLPRAVLVEKLQTSTETSLSKANFLRTTKLEVMQAFTMYLVPLCRAEVSRAHSALTGTAIRLAECMGLHRDGSIYGFSAVETHVRRLVWYHLCFLDIRTVEATGPRPQIHKEQFDTKLPLNVDEDELLKTPAPTEDAQRFTDMTLSRLRFEVYEMHRQIWHDLPRIDAKKIKLSAALSRVQKFKADLEARYLPLLRGSDPRQTLAVHVYRIAGSRFFTMLLHRYFTGMTSDAMPERLRRILLDAVLATNEFTISLETGQELAPWAWYRGALLQYHSALLVLFEVYNNPNSSYAPRIWKCLDYVFELPPSMTADQKADSVLFALRDRLQIYQSMRKMRATVSADEALQKVTGPYLVGMPTSEGVDASLVEHKPIDPGVEFSFPTTTQMDVTQFTMPPLRHQGTSSEGDSQGNTQSRLSPMDTTQNSVSDEFDWGGEWEQLFPADTSQHFGAADLSSFSLGSFTAFSGNIQITSSGQVRGR